MNSRTSQEVLAELNRAHESAYNLRDSVRIDHLTRAKICSKLIKYPHIEDYSVCYFNHIVYLAVLRTKLGELLQLALQDHDEKQIFLARQHLVDMRNLYAILTDLIHKNIIKVYADPFQWKCCSLLNTSFVDPCTKRKQWRIPILDITYYFSLYRF